jgi:cardiolipin synthase
LVTIPNLITIARLVLVPLIVWLMITEQAGAAFVVFIIAGVSDAVDGFLARTLNLRSTLGSYLDPLADKALLVSIYISLAALGDLPAWVVILVVSRDLFIVGAVMLSWMLGQPMEMRPLIISKLNTVVQIVLAAVVLGDLALGAGLEAVRTILVYLVGMLTIASAAIYRVDWVRHMAAGETAAGTPDGPQDGRWPR